MAWERTGAATYCCMASSATCSCGVDVFRQRHCRQHGTSEGNERPPAEELEAKKRWLKTSTQTRSWLRRLALQAITLV